MPELPLTQQDLALVALVAAGVALIALIARLFLPRRRSRVTPPPHPAPAGLPAFHQTMTPGREYMIVQSFVDYDGVLRSAGERWVFKGYDFLPYEDGLTLFTDPGPGVRLQWRPESQGEIIERLGDYLRAV
jgi:hypothetical protein